MQQQIASGFEFFSCGSFFILNWKNYRIDNCSISFAYIATCTNILENNGLCIHTYAVQLAKLKVNSQIV